MKNILNNTPFEEVYGYHQERQRLVNKKQIQGKVVLDIGCGFGGWLWVCYQNGAKKIIGLEISRESLKVASSLKKKNVELVSGSALKLPFKDNSLDTVTSWEVLEHIPNGTEEQMFKEVYRVLKPGGFFYLSTQYRNLFSTTLDPAWWLIGHRHYTFSQVRRFSQDSGFKIVKLYTKGGLSSILLSLDVYICKWVFRRGPLFEEFLLNKTKQEFAKNKGFFNIFLSCQKTKAL